METICADAKFSTLTIVFGWSSDFCPTFDGTTVFNEGPQNTGYAWDQPYNSLV